MRRGLIDRTTRARISWLEAELDRLDHELADYEDMLRFRVMPPEVDVRGAIRGVEAQMAKYQRELARMEDEIV